MQIEYECGNRVWVGSPKIDRLMGVERGLIVLRCRNKDVLNKMASVALKRTLPQRSIYIYSKDAFENKGAEFIEDVAGRLEISENILMNNVNMINLSTNRPTALEDGWNRVSEAAEGATLAVLDGIGTHPGRDAVLIERLDIYCYAHDSVALVLDDSGSALDPTLERLAAVVLELDVRDVGVEVYLRKHPQLEETVFLMAK